MREPFGKEEGKTKRENCSNTSSTLQHGHNTRTNLQFIPWEKKSGNGEREGERGGGAREGEGNWSDFVSEREEEEEEEEEVGSVFDQDGGSLQTWGPLASQDRQKPPK